MNPYNDIPRCRTCRPGTITFQEGDYVCIQCGKPAWISEHLKAIKSKAKTSASLSGGWRGRLLKSRDSFLLV